MTTCAARAGSVGAHPDPAGVLGQLAAVRVSVGVVVAVLLVGGPYGSSLSVLAPTLQRPEWLLQFPSQPVTFALLRWLTVGLALLSAAGVRPGLVLPSAALAFGVINGMSAGFTPAWSYNTHLNLAFCVLALCHALPTSAGTPCPERAALGLSTLRLGVGVLYLQAGLSKLLAGGVAWFVTGDTARAFALRSGTDLGRVLPDWLFALGSMATGVLEFGFLPVLLLVPRAAPLAAAAALGFHLTTWLVMGISFWHLWVLFPALFFWRKPQEDA